MSESLLANTSQPANHGLPFTDFQTLFESAPDLYLVLRPDLRIAAASDAYLRATMTRREEIVGQHLFDVFPDNPDDPYATGVRNLGASLQRVLRDKAPDAVAIQRYDIRRPEAEGGGFEERFWSLLNSPILGPDGEVKFILHRVEDVTESVRATERRRAEQHSWWLTLSSIGDGVIATDAQGRITLLNAPAEQLTGWGHKEALGKTLSEVFAIKDEQSGQPADNPLDRVLREGVVVGMGNQIVLTARDGQGRPIDSSAAPILDDAGVVQGCVLVFRDVSEKRRAERELRALEARLTAIIDHSPSCIFAKDRQGRYTLANRALASLVNREPGELPGRTDADFFPPEVAARFRQDDARVMATRQPVVYEESFPHEGTTITALTVKFPLVDPDGQVYAVCGIATDITAHRQAEQALRESEEKFRLLADLIPQLAFMTRPDGHVFWYNRRWYDYTGTTHEQMEGWGWQSVHDPTVLPEVLERWKASLATGEPFDMVLPLRGVDGRFRPFLTRVMPLRGEDGSVRAWFGTNTDITDMREADERLRRQVERLRLLNESAAHLLHATDADEMVRGLFERVKSHLGVDTYFNFMVNEAGDALRMESCAGIPTAEAAKITRLEFGQAICGTVALQRRAIVATAIGQSDDPRAQLVKRFGINSYACNPLLADDRLLGTLSFASHTRECFTDDELEFMGTLCHYVTVAYERVRLVKELREADRRKDEFLAMLAHELRNPLAPIRNALQILRMRNTDGVTADKARDMMDRQLQHLVRLVDDLLDVSRIMQGKIELRKEDVDLRLVVARAAEIAQPVIDAQGHELRLTLPPEAIPVEGDSVRLAQVIANLLSNAAKYTERAGRIALTLEADDQTALLRVKDNGIGIPADLLPRVFDLFVQGDRSSARTQGGLGIGLTLVKRLVTMHGGSIAAFSEGAGQGSEFVLRLPVLQHGSEPAGHAGYNRAGQSRGRRVLVVDDNVDAAESLAMLLRLMDHEVHTVHDGPAALEAVRAYQPELILLDIGLPGMDGYEVARRLRLTPGGKSVRLVAVSGYGQDDDRLRSRAAGFDQHMVKPVDPADLERLVSAVDHLPVNPR